MAERHISLPKPFLGGDAADWFQRFEICSKINGWDAAAKAGKLPTLLEGEALAVWLELTTEQQDNYAAAKKEIQAAMMPMGFLSLDEFHRRKLHPGEAISVFIHDLKKLLKMAVPSLDKAAKEPLLLHQFVAGLPEGIMRQLRVSGEVKTLEAAVTRARLLMAVESQSVAAIEESTNQGAATNESSDVQQLRDQVAVLTEQVALSTRQRNTNQPQTRNRLRCFSCNQLGHVLRDCPARNRLCFTCGHPGHLSRNCWYRQGNEQGAPVLGNRRPRQ